LNNPAALSEKTLLTSYGISRKMLVSYDGCRNLEVAPMPKELPTLGEMEVQVMRLIWEHQPCTERQISDLVRQERNVARTTVLKTMQRLEAKKLLVRVPGEGPVRFRAAVEASRVLPQLIRRFVEGILGGSPEPLVAYLAESQNLSGKDLELLRNIARKVQEQK
jgi:BlaI family penicillinase repressor